MDFLEPENLIFLALYLSKSSIGLFREARLILSYVKGILKWTLGKTFSKYCSFFLFLFCFVLFFFVFFDAMAISQSNQYLSSLHDKKSTFWKIAPNPGPFTTNFPWSSNQNVVQNLSEIFQEAYCFTVKALDPFSSVMKKGLSSNIS